MAITYNVYQGSTKIANVSTLSRPITGLLPGKAYEFFVSQTDGADESAKAKVIVKTNGLIELATTKQNATVKYYQNALGTETGGLGTSNQFGGSTPTAVSVLKKTYVTNKLTLEIPNQYHLSGTPTKISETEFLLISGNRTLKIILS